MAIELLIVPIALQALAMVVDEGWFHRRRGLPRWERIGHPLDTLTIVFCLLWLVTTAPAAPAALPIFIALAAFSTLFVTKDEPVHARLCSAGEHWLHSILFVLHPTVLAAFGVIWWSGGHRGVLIAQLVATSVFFVYQVIYWNVVRDRTVESSSASPSINNSWYSDLGSRWYEADDTPIALLRAEARHRNPWIAERIEQSFGARTCRVLDLGCGAGFLSNDLAARGHRVTGVDSSEESLAVARARDATGSAVYYLGDARALPDSVESFEVVCAMDLLEHVDDPAAVIAEAGRVLAPGGLFFFHTFNRTWMSKLIVIKGVEWFVKNTPKGLHVIELFLKPEEVAAMCTAHGLAVAELRGSRPRFRWPLWRMLATGRVGSDFEFTFTGSTKLGFTGIARKRINAHRSDRSTTEV